MTDKQKIRSEIINLKEKMEKVKDPTAYWLGRTHSYDDILSFIDSMQEDHDTSDWIQELESMSEEQVRERMERVNAWYNEQFVSEEPASEDLELAAKRILGGYASMGTFQDGKMYTEECMLDICMAGANWQKEKDVRDLFMSDNRNFKKCYELGKADMKQQMMKDATDAFIRRNRYTKLNVLNGLDMTCKAIQDFKNGDKLKVIFIKED